MSIIGIIDVATAAAEKLGPLSSRLALAGDEGPKDVLVPEKIPLLPIPAPPLGGPVCSIPEKDTFSKPLMDHEPLLLQSSMDQLLTQDGYFHLL